MTLTPWSMSGLAIARCSDQAEHVVAHASFHGIWLAVFIFNPRCSSSSRHFLKSLVELCIGLGDAFGGIWSLGFLFGIR